MGTHPLPLLIKVGFLIIVTERQLPIGGRVRSGEATRSDGKDGGLQCINRLGNSSCLYAFAALKVDCQPSRQPVRRRAKGFFRLAERLHQRLSKRRPRGPPRGTSPPFRG